ncbi:MAG TPA: hypothetical protein VLS85_13215 [Hanamia sp.]|nr:hypothetical protein [Hanamia sp.]
MKKVRWDLIGILGGVAGVVIAILSVLKSGGPDRVYIAIAMVIVFGGMGYIINKFLWAPKANLRRLNNTGIPGKAKILEVHETNVAVNNNPQLRLVLELNNNGEVYTTNCKTIVSKFTPNYFQPGKEVNVKIDPANEKNVIVDFG